MLHGTRIPYLRFRAVDAFLHCTSSEGCYSKRPILALRKSPMHFSQIQQPNRPLPFLNIIVEGNLKCDCWQSQQVIEFVSPARARPEGWKRPGTTTEREELSIAKDAVRRRLVLDIPIDDFASYRPLWSHWLMEGIVKIGAGETFTCCYYLGYDLKLLSSTTNEEDFLCDKHYNRTKCFELIFDSVSRFWKFS